MTKRDMDVYDMEWSVGTLESLELTIGLIVVMCLNRYTMG